MTAARARQVAAVRIDAQDERAWLGAAPLDLTPRAFAVLRRLVEHAGKLVTKTELLSTVWHDAVVSDAALASCIRDLRRALGDPSEAPRYIETVHRRGFRFIGPIAPAAAFPSGPRAPGAERDAGFEAAPNDQPKAPTLVGREAELGRLRELLGRAVAGQRQVVFVTGEAGIGKTALVERFLADIGLDRACRVGRGQCVEQYGAGEAYLPVLEALGRLGRGAGGDGVVQALKRHAPTWLTQLPALLSDRDLEAVQRRAHGATRDRMLRELVEALDALGAETPLVLVLEDLHWSDASTIDLLARVARRRDPARLLVVGTYRPADVAASGHPLRPVTQELQLHGHCEELELDFLGVTAVAQYLSERFAPHRFPPELAAVLHRSTGGNPLFVVSTVDDLLARGHLAEVDGVWALAVPVASVASEAPETLWQMVDKQVERLAPEEQAVLGVASVAGAEFSAAVASADGIDPVEAERRCEALARRGQFLRAAGVVEWPDGTVAARYAFIHAMYQQGLYARLSIARRAGLHLRIGERLERGYGERAGEIAGELAVHFEHGRDIERAVRYRRRAGEHALGKHGYREAADHGTRALELLGAVPDSADRTEQELAVQVMLGAALTATRGYAAREVADCYVRARELCEHVGDTVRLLPVLLGLGRFHLGRGEVEIARAVGVRLLAIAERTGDAAVALAAHHGLGIVAFYAGEFAPALEHLEAGLSLYDDKAHSPLRSQVFRAGQDPGVSCEVYAALALQVLGFPARAAERMRRALALAHALAHPFSVAYACHFAAGFHILRGEWHAVDALEGEARACSEEHGFRIFPMMAAIHVGRLLAAQGRPDDGQARIREGIEAMRAIGIELRRPAFVALLAEAFAAGGRAAEGLDAVAEGLAASERTGQRYWDAELYRLRGVLGQRVAGRDAEAALRRAVEIARGQGARLLELRAATSLGRLWAERGDRGEARALLSAIVGGFTEGFDAIDLTDARSLLDRLGPA